MAPTLECMVNQGLRPDEYELLLINDGSTDGSEAVCREFISAHPELNIRFFTGPNRGVSAARNTGIENACGEYIHFMDSDDILTPGFYRFLLDNFTEENADYIQFLSTTVYSESQIQPSDIPQVRPEGKIVQKLSGHDMLRQGSIPESPWTGLYRRDYLVKHSLYFPVDIALAEDYDLNIRFFATNPRVVKTDSCPYIWRLHKGSSWHKASSPARIDRFISGTMVTFNNLSDTTSQYPDLADGIRRIMNYRVAILTPDILRLGMSYTRFKEFADDFKKMGVVPTGCPGKISRIADFLFTHPAIYPLASRLFCNVVHPLYSVYKYKK